MMITRQVTTTASVPTATQAAVAEAEASATTTTSNNNNNVILPLPPGMEILIGDKKYKVQYQSYEMTREKATEYIAHSTGTPYTRMGSPTPISIPPSSLILQQQQQQQQREQQQQQLSSLLMMEEKEQIQLETIILY